MRSSPGHGGPWRFWPAALIALLLVGTGLFQSWVTALSLLNMGLVSAVMAMGLNMQWGYAGLLNAGVMGFVALGGLATVLIAMPPVGEAWSAGGGGIIMGLLIGVATLVCAALAWRHWPRGRWRSLATGAILVAGYWLFRSVFDPATAAVEAVDASTTGYLGGLGLPILLAWPVGGLLAAGAAWVIGQTSLSLRSDYLAIATLGIGEIILSAIKNEDWLARGIKNVVALPRPAPYEIDLQTSSGFIDFTAALRLDLVIASSLTVKLIFSGLFLCVLLVLVWLNQRAYHSPWGRMMRAIRDNRTAAAAMGKNVKARHLQIFILGSALCGLAGAMMVTLDGQFVPGTYYPLRFTFLVWIMVIVGGSGSPWGAVFGGMIVWWLWVQVEPIGLWLMQVITAGMAADSPLRLHLIGSAAHMRLPTMGLFLLLMLRLKPRGFLPER